MSDSMPPAETAALLSDQFEAFTEELETLYILANRGGRINFMKNWPLAAHMIFGSELIQADTHGTDDAARRAELEAAAETRRIELLEMLDTLEDKSVDAGALQIEYVQGVVHSLGRDIALLVYARTIVDRFIPPSAEELAAQAEAVATPPETQTADSPASASGPMPVPVEVSPSAPDQTRSRLDDGLPAQPIDTAKPSSAQSPAHSDRQDKTSDTPPPSISTKPMTAADVAAPASSGGAGQETELTPLERAQAEHLKTAKPDKSGNDDEPS